MCKERETEKIYHAMRKLLLSYTQIKEIANQKQISYYDAYGVVVMLRIRQEGLRVAFGKLLRKL